MSARRKDKMKPGEWPDLLTVEQSACYLNVARQTVAFWIWRKRSLPYVSLGTGTRRMCRVRKSVLDALIKDGERSAMRLVKSTKERRG